MASELSNYLANAILNWVKGSAMPTAPATVYVALFNGSPTVTGTGGTEVTTTIRTAGRVAVSWAAVAARAIDNSAVVDFGSAVGAATVNHLAIFDAATAGNMLGFTPLDTARTVAIGDPVVIPIGDLELNFN